MWGLRITAGNGSAPATAPAASASALQQRRLPSPPPPMARDPSMPRPLATILGNIHGDEDIHREALLHWVWELCEIGVAAGYQGPVGGSPSPQAPSVSALLGVATPASKLDAATVTRWVHTGACMQLYASLCCSLGLVHVCLGLWRHCPTLKELLLGPAQSPAGCPQPCAPRSLPPPHRVKELLLNTVVHVVPTTNPDGAWGEGGKNRCALSI